MFSLSSLGLDSGTIKALFVSYLIVGVMSLFICVALYFLKAIGIYYMSKNTEQVYCWYSFVPFFKEIAIGKLATVNKKTDKFASVMLITKIIAFAFALVSFLLFVSSAVEIVFRADEAMVKGSTLTKEALTSLVAPFVTAAISVLATVVYKVFYYISLFRIYKYFARKTLVLYFIFSLVFPVLVPIFLFVIRNNNYIDGDGKGTSPYFVM